MHSPRVGAGPAKAPRTGSLGLALWVQLRHPPCARRHCAGGILSTWACVRVCLRRPPRTLIASGRPSGSRPGSSATPVLNARSAEAAAPASSASTPHAPQNALPPDLPPPSRLCRRSAARRRREEASSTIARRRSGFEWPSAAEKRVAARPSQQHRSAGTQPLLCRASEAMLTTHPSLFAIGAAQGRARACVTQGGKLRHASSSRVLPQSYSRLRACASRCAARSTRPCPQRPDWCPDGDARPPRLRPGIRRAEDHAAAPRARRSEGAPSRAGSGRGGGGHAAGVGQAVGRVRGRGVAAKGQAHPRRGGQSVQQGTGALPRWHFRPRPRCLARAHFGRAGRPRAAIAELCGRGPLSGRACASSKVLDLVERGGAGSVLFARWTISESGAGGVVGQEARGWSSRAWWPPSAHFSPRDVRLAVGGGGFD